MRPRFDLGKVTVKEEAAYALSRSGQESAFFLDRHASGDWGEGDPEHNERGLREGSMVLSKYRTLWSHEILGLTFPDRRETYLFCPPNTVIKYVPLPDLAIWGKKPAGEAMQQQPGNGSSRVEIRAVHTWIAYSVAHSRSEWATQKGTALTPVAFRSGAGRV
jgi:hypothetical protein